MAVTKTIALTGAGIWIVPTDCDVLVPAITWGMGAGGGGGRGRLRYCGGGGGGGGAYSLTTVTLPAIGSNTWYSAGVGGVGGSADGADGTDGADTWFSIVSNAAPVASADGFLAKGGSKGLGTTFTGGAGGDAASGIGTTTTDGGAGGDSGLGNNGVAGGGGGGSAGSDLGDGHVGGNGYAVFSLKGSGGGGGGTGGDGSNGVNVGAVAGGLSYTGGAGGAAGGGPGTHGAGGGSTQQDSFSPGGQGGDGTEYTLSDGTTVGSGGGAGGPGGGENQGTGSTGGRGGLYGGGGSGGSGTNWNHSTRTFNGGAGANGIILITYQVLPGGPTNRVNNLIAQAVIANHQEDLDRPSQHNLRALTINLDGHSFYILYLDEEGVIVYDQTTQTWSEWNSFTPSDATAPWRGRCGWNWGVDKIIGDDNIGLLWDMTNEEYIDEPPYIEDYSYTITAILTGGLPIMGRNTTNCAGVLLTCSAISDTLTDPTVKLELSDDQGATFSSQGSLNLTTDLSQEIQWLSLGKIVQPLRVFRLTDTGIPRVDDLETWSRY